MKQPTAWIDQSGSSSVTDNYEGFSLLLETGGHLLLETGGELLFEGTVITPKQPTVWAES